MVAIPPPLQTLIATGIGVYVHDTYDVSFPPGVVVPLAWAPQSGMVYIVFGITYGRPLDPATNTFIYSSLFGFSHSHPQMRLHWDPAVISLYDYEYPHYLEVTSSVPVSITIMNLLAITIRWDFTLHYIQIRQGFLPFVRKLWLKWMGISEDETMKLVKEIQ